MSVQQSSSNKILIVTSCTKDKVLPAHLNGSLVPASQLWDDRDDDRTRRNYGDLEPYRVPAAQLYRGLQHRELMRGVELLRRTFGQTLAIDVKIVSAGFGVVDEHQLLPPYETTFAGQSQTSIAAVSRRLGIPRAINALLKGAYDCAFFLLGDQYLSSLSLPWAADPQFPCLFLASPKSPIPNRSPYALVPAGKDEGSAYRYNLVGLKGHMFKLFAEQLVSPWTQTQVFQSCATADARLQSFISTPTPQFFLSSIRPGSRRDVSSSNGLVVQQSLFPDVCIKASGTRAKNYGKPVRYYIPDWDDIVDPGYDFEHDQPTQQRKQYAHEIYGRPNYDGLLFSKSTVEGRTKVERIQAMGGIHAFARFEGKPILGDCGAFNYITDKEPPYSTTEILDYYERYGFTYGVSIDHLIVPAFYHEKEYRYQLTRENAREFIRLHRAGNYHFEPIGVAQGWSPETYRDAVVELLECGYSYIALGGIARTQTKDIYDILEAVAPVLQADVDVHLFGVARDKDGDEMQRFRALGVTSFDSASFLRRAWLGDQVNYLTEAGQGYTALRISPITTSSPRVKKILNGGHVTFEQLQELERNALKALREYDMGRLDLETTLTHLLAMDQMEGDTQHEQAYRRTLEDQPWKRCPCAICRDLGIEVMIFRGNDRNRRRGFHNTWVFYRRFQKLMERGKRA